MIGHATSFSNDKGGVGKTTLVANVGGLAAASGWRVLLVDLDPQGDLALDLGVTGEAEEEQGRGLASAVFGQVPLLEVPLRSVRENLDLIPAGPRTKELREVLSVRSKTGERFGLTEALSKLAGEYDWILIDTPPSDLILQGFGLAAAHYVVAPTKADLASMRAIGRLSENALSFGNPDLELIGVALFGVESNAKAIKGEVLKQLTEWLGSSSKPFDTVIRHATLASKEMRENGWLAIEYEEKAEASRLANPWWKSRREGKKAQPAQRFASNSSALREDYTALAKEIMGEFRARQVGDR
jgi:chromosome partitioning protein